MADLHIEMNTFHDRIALSPGTKAVLRTVRDAIREHIRKYFHETLNISVPKFRGQGAYAMDTMVNPIGSEYDIDDGVYLQHLDNRDDSGWPAAATIHQWLMQAAGNHTREKPTDKRTCVRVRYASLYHVDLPAYAELNGQFRLADKGDARWPHSDPMTLTYWFNATVKFHGEQLRRLVRYLKAWADFQAGRWGAMPGGLILTVLAANHFEGHARDDIALANTFEAISHAVNTVFYVLNPVDIGEVLSERLADAQKIRFQNAVKAAADDAHQANAQKDAHRASKQWRKLLGDRFPLAE